MVLPNMTATPTISLEWIKSRILHALTEYDRKQSLKKHYNPYALGIYCGALNDWENDSETSENPLKTLPTYFTTLRDEGDWFHITTLNKTVKEIQTRFPHLTLK